MKSFLFAALAVLMAVGALAAEISIIDGQTNSRSSCLTFRGNGKKLDWGGCTWPRKKKKQAKAVQFSYTETGRIAPLTTNYKSCVYRLPDETAIWSTDCETEESQWYFEEGRVKHVRDDACLVYNENIFMMVNCFFAASIQGGVELY